MIWLTWDDHRRSRELANALNANYIVIESSRSRLVRYLILSVRTLRLLRNKRPKTIICQNPSVVLATILCIWKGVFGYKLLVDRHTNFKFGTEKSLHPKWQLFHKLSNYSIRRADITIVTNEPLARIVESRGGRAFVLPDKLPKFSGPVEQKKLNGEFNCLFICTFSDDEPVGEVLDAFSKLPEDYCLYVTGKFEQYSDFRRYEKRENIFFLGFIPEDEYLSYLHSCDAAIVLTTMPMTLNCGSYEAISAEKVQIVSGTPEIMSYFNDASVYVSNLTAENIREAVKTARIKRREVFTETAIRAYKKTLEDRWQERFMSLKRLI